MVHPMMPSSAFVSGGEMFLSVFRYVVMDDEDGELMDTK